MLIRTDIHFLKIELRGVWLRGEFLEYHRGMLAEVTANCCIEDESIQSNSSSLIFCDGSENLLNKWRPLIDEACIDLQQVGTSC